MSFTYPAEIVPRLKGHYARLKQLDQAIPELQAELDQLIQERRALRREVLSYPILTLPTELTCEIFVNCVSGRVMPSPLTAPLLLAQICSQWRVIAFSLPELWNRVRTRRMSPNIVQLLGLWFKRTRDVPISISLSSQSPLPQMFSWDDLRPRNWEHASLLLPEVELARLDGIDFSTLKTLAIGPSQGNNISQSAVRGFKTATQLCEVTLLRGLGPSLIHLPWHQLTTLSAAQLTVRECVEVLRFASRLTHCTAFIHRRHAQSALLKFTHPRLRELILQYGGPADIDLLRRLELPSLSRIQLTLESGAENAAHFVEFAAQSPLLQRISVEAGALSPDEFIQCLAATPAVTTLEFQSPKRLAETWRGLGSSVCLPMLTHLSITDEGSYLDNAAYEVLVEMLRSRSRSDSTAKLRAFSLMVVTQSQPPKFYVAKELDALRGIGIDICIETRKKQLYPPKR
ncbi:hypothetical protein DFH06DRAFT_337091 [Mycena polygramma]|nr:hypothetical protein DFH06DRAFT_337091 [Mycena polygramma]